MIRPACCALLLAGCIVEDPGTAVGNPGKLGMAGAEASTDITLATFDVEVDAVELLPCSGLEYGATIPVGATIDARVGEEVATLPPGLWCGLIVVLADVEAPVVLEGDTVGGAHFYLGLAPADIAFDDVFRVDGNQLLIALSVETLLRAASVDGASDTGDDVDAEPGDELSDSAAAEFGVASRLYSDENADGALDPGDKLAADLDVADNPTTCEGCASTRAGPWWVALLGLLALTVRRRRSEATPRGR